MSKIQELREIITSFEGLVSMSTGNNPIEAKVWSGWKPSSYYVPDIFIGRDSSPEAFKRHEESRNSLSWFVEVWINNTCVWRQHSTDPDKEEILAGKIINDLIFYGLHASWRDTVERNKQHGI